MFYVEPFSTKDIDAFVLVPKDRFVIELPGWAYLKKRGYTEIRNDRIVVEGWPVQFLPVANDLEREAYLNAQTLEFDGVSVRVVLAEHLVAIMLEVGRTRDLARIEMFLEQEAVDITALEEIVQRHGLFDKWRQFKNSYDQQE